MITTLRSLWKDEDGLTTVEYALLLALWQSPQSQRGRH